MSARAQHASVMLQEAIDALALKPDGTYVDCTFGGGGHSRRILDALDQNGRLIAFDRDAYAAAIASKFDNPRFTFVRGGFSELREHLNALGINKANGILLDLGVSSPQLDAAERGFSFRLDGPLDMRMDQSQGESAAEWLARVAERDLGEVIKAYGEERFAKQIARAIVAARAKKPIATTRELAEIISAAQPYREPGKDPATRTFQAIRIYINQELAELSRVLPQTVSLLAPSGRLVVISFHSLEDRIVKRFMQDESRPDRLPPNLPVRARDLPAPRLRLIGRAQRPSPAEVERNPRARSAVLRVAERTDAAA